MNDPIRVLPLPNGLTVAFFDHSRRYFGDYYRVKLEVVCRIPLSAGNFASDEAYAEALGFYGNEVVYSRSEEQMGVPSADIKVTLERLIENFMEHSLPYVSSPRFPEKFVHAELKKKAGKRARL
jgi:hypothetical protein